MLPFHCIWSDLIDFVEHGAYTKLTQLHDTLRSQFIAQVTDDSATAYRAAHCAPVFSALSEPTVLPFLVHAHSALCTRF